MNRCECKFNHKSTALTAGSDLIITVDCSDGICDKEPFNILVCQCLPQIAVPIQVYVTVNGVSTPLLDKQGNYVYSNQIKPRKPYYGVYGDNPAHVLLYNESGF